MYILVNIFSFNNEQITLLSPLNLFFWFKENIYENRLNKPSSPKLFKRLLWWPMLGVRRRSWIIIIVTFFVGVHIWLIFRLNIYRFIVIRNVLIIGYSFPTSFLRWLTRTTNVFPIDEFSTLYVMSDDGIWSSQSKAYILLCPGRIPSPYQVTWWKSSRF